MSSTVVLVGLGNMGRKYLNKLLELNVKPTLCDLNFELKREFQNFPFYHSYRDIEGNPSTVFVAINPQFHPEVAQYFLSKGAFVLLEKPPALNYIDLARLAENFGGYPFGVSEIERYSLAVKNFKPDPHKVKAVLINRLNGGRGYINPIWDLAWHDLYLILYLFGEFEIKTVERKGDFYYRVRGEILKSIPFELNVAWNYPNVDRSWTILTSDGEIVLDFLNERRLENGKTVSLRKGKDKLYELVKDCLSGKYDTLSVQRALFILKELEKRGKNL
ncbi:MAG TPA: Gfo/Idh/MocA family oxidoreductase [Aquifex aeolicus]|uniref:Gfo/Idh/MocA family oxidoreductase n=1 Tax=Aquifex aeolicus TaxID=63363 RepID=A0A9D1CFK4_AQUAO|nr:Gfo/Idh/MocA family oxidoreductase [Aquificales bacterium]HIP98531.1 Gfo/Idh/MocA family oxidoreductase [Aquifex aeolicus]HIQ26755.1 Gfo/Idh/MocA family oxidoreductase [Aquifex aeolicus]